MRQKHAKLFVLLILGLAVVIAGCGDRIQVELPPKAPVEGINTVAILPFESVAADPGLGFEFEDRIAQVLRESGWYSSVVTARVSSPKPGGYSVSQLQTAESARAIGRELNADAIIVGTATYYFEDVYMGVPQCSGCNRPEVRPSWSVSQHTNVVVRLSARMIDVRTGREIHSRTSAGEDSNFRTHFLSWNNHEPPPESLIPNPNRQQVPFTRGIAIDRAVRDFTRDILPRYEWRSID